MAQRCPSFPEICYKNIRQITRGVKIAIKTIMIEKKFTFLMSLSNSNVFYK